MRALKFEYNPNIVNTDIAPGLERDDWLVTVIRTSLFTNRRAAKDELPAWADDAGGYWGDDPQQSYGSLLWTLKREKINAQTLSRIRAMCFDALNWLVKGQHISALDVLVTAVGTRAKILVTTTRNGKTFEQEEIF